MLKKILVANVKLFQYIMYLILVTEFYSELQKTTYPHIFHTGLY